MKGKTQNLTFQTVSNKVKLSPNARLRGALESAITEEMNNEKQVEMARILVQGKIHQMIDELLALSA